MNHKDQFNPSWEKKYREEISKGGEMFTFTHWIENQLDEFVASTKRFKSKLTEEKKRNKKHVLEYSALLTQFQENTEECEKLSTTLRVTNIDDAKKIKSLESQLKEAREAKGWRKNLIEEIEQERQKREQAEAKLKAIGEALLRDAIIEELSYDVYPKDISKGINGEWEDFNKYKRASFIKGSKHQRNLIKKELNKIN